MKKLIKLIIIIMIIALVGFGSYYAYDNYVKKSDDVKVVKKIKNYGYELSSNETALYKEKFNELDKILSKKSIDYEAYAKKISELFIIDFYTLDNKLSKNDIGGVQFIKESMRDNFIEEARSTFYKYVEQKDNRTQKLPVVSKINSIEVNETTFTVDYNDDNESSTTKNTTQKTSGVEYEAYKISISWSYLKNLGYEKKANLIIIKDGKMLYIVEMD